MGSRLANAASAYLRSAQHQPVDWYPWGPEPFERALSEHKPVLLDIGAVWCHWCHVMDRESYDDPAVAGLLNRDWICIKVDRDERPDVDARYQRAVQLISGQGGWPLTAFLTPEGQVFYGGTYFPPEGAHGRPGFLTLLQQLAQVYREQPDDIAKQVDQIRTRLSELRSQPTRGAISAGVLRDAADAMARVFDFRYGGFGTQPKFPHPTACDFLLAQWRDADLPWAREMVDRTLVAMARGGIRDHVGGGFHRYAVDGRWIVPHFEKMSYDNAELTHAYVHAAASVTDVLPAPPGAEGDLAGLYREVIAGIVSWVETVLSDPRGGYFASQDADVGLDDDGDYFTWTVDEVRDVVTAEEFAVLKRRYDIEPQGEMHHNPAKNVLWVAQTISQIAEALARDRAEVEALLASGLEKLRHARDQRPTPTVDRALYVNWNAMMVSAMLAAAAFLRRPDTEAHALRTLERLVAEARHDGHLRHVIGGDVPALLDDHVHLARAALDAFEATGRASWLEVAADTMECVWRDFRTGDGRLVDRSLQHDAIGMLTESITPLEDAPTPSPVGIAAIVLARLHHQTGDPRWLDRATELLDAVGGAISQLGLHGASLTLAASWAVAPVAHIVVVAEPGADRDALLHTARTAYHPRKVIRALAPGADTATLPEPVRAMVTGDVPRAYVCVGTHCSPPARDPADLLAALERS